MGSSCVHHHASLDFAVMVSSLVSHVAFGEEDDMDEISCLLVLDSRSFAVYADDVYDPGSGGRVEGRGCRFANLISGSREGAASES